MCGSCCLQPNRAWRNSSLIGCDTDALRSNLKKQGIKPGIPGKSDRKKRIRYDEMVCKGATLSSAASDASKTSAASARVTTSSPETSSRHFVEL
jgi:hypothetical protein